MIDSSVLLGKMFLFDVVVFLLFFVLTLLFMLILSNNKSKRSSLIVVFVVMMLLYLGLIFWIALSPDMFVAQLMKLGVLK